jgi:hypothetical protein
MNGGTLIRVCHKTLFDFGYLSTGVTDEIVVAKAINVIPYSAAYLWVRVYQLRLGTGSPTIKVRATPALPAEDTQQSFLGTPIDLNITATGLANTTLTASGPLPPYFQISVQGMMPGTLTNVGAELSIDLLVRCCG